ncbi:MAG TPA: sugar ABC transporter substrate-binding protein [Roseiflexaceae bacterium]|nr:sugar ABC transporter substrate-binding protein [Roseiflexaceae bacterium]
MRERIRQRLSLRRAHTGASVGLVLLLFITLLAACGGQPAPGGTAATSAPASGVTDATSAPASGATSAPQTGGGTPTTIRWMIWADNIANDKNLQDEINLFNSSQSEVKVELIGAPWAEYTPKLQAMIAANTPPDVVAIQNEADFVSKGFVLPLDDLIASDPIDVNRFVPGAITPAYDGKIYGFRHDTAYWLLFYNKDLFDAAGVAYPPASGWTIDQFMEAACKLSKPDQGQWGMHNLHWVTGILAQQQGLPYLSMVNGVPQYQINDPKTMAFYQKIGDFINKQNCQPTADQNSSLGGADPFIAGKAAMKFDGNWAFGSMKQNAQFNYDVAPLPGLKQPNVGMKIGIVPTSPNQAAAWKFLKWLTYEPEATRFRTERGLGQPALNDEQSVQTFISGPSSPASLGDVFKVLSDPANSFAVLDVPGASEANNIINPASDEVMNGLSPATDVLPPAVEQANQVLSETWEKATK